MSLPENIAKSVSEVEKYLFAVMNFAFVLSKSSSDDIYSVSSPLQAMGDGVIEHFEKIREHLERQQTKPSLNVVSSLQNDKILD